MGRSNPAATHAETTAKEARKALLAYNLTPAIQVSSRPVDGVLTHTTASTQHIPIRSTPAGTWWLQMKWRYQLSPADGGAFLAESSISLNVDHDALPGQENRCLVRYDYEGWGAGRGPHLNVMQARTTPMIALLVPIGPG